MYAAFACWVMGNGERDRRLALRRESSDVLSEDFHMLLELSVNGEINIHHDARDDATITPGHCDNWYVGVCVSINPIVTFQLRSRTMGRTTPVHMTSQ